MYSETLKSENIHTVFPKFSEWRFLINRFKHIYSNILVERKPNPLDLDTFLMKSESAILDFSFRELKSKANPDFCS